MEGERAGEGSGSEQRLTSWKAIARYLGRDVRTAMRWERDAGMPVHRVPGRGSKSPVFAYPSELDGWLSGNAAPAPPPASPRARWVLPAAAVTLGVLAVILAMSWGATGTPPEVDASAPSMTSRSRAAGPLLKGLDAAGREVWSLAHPEGRDFTEADAVAVRVTAPDGGTRWIIGANTLVPPSIRYEEGELFAVDEGGRVAWRQRISSSTTFGEGSFGPPWTTRTVTTVGTGPRAPVLWAVHHYTWWPASLRVLSSDGALLGEFTNAGWILDVVSAEVGGRLMVFAGGISNSRRSAMLAVLDADSVKGSSPEDEGSGFACTSCGPWGPERYLTFSPTELNRTIGLPYNRTLSVGVTGEGIEVIVQEGSPESDIAWVYLVAPDFRSVRAAPSDSYWARHDALHAAGQIGHPAAECPERSTPPAVRMWAPSTGWLELPIQMPASPTSGGVRSP